MPGTNHRFMTGFAFGAAGVRELRILDFGLRSEDSEHFAIRNPQSSIRSAAAQHAERRVEEQPEVDPQALVLGIPQVHAYPIFEADLAAAADLPEACEAGSDGEPA